MRVLHVMAGAREGAGETMMLDGATALAEAGVEQIAVTRPDNAERAERLARSGVGVIPATFDKVWRKPTEKLLKQTIKDFAPDVIQYWMGRAGAFAPKRFRVRNLGWHGGYYKLERFKHCAWHAGVTRDIAQHIVGQGAPKDQVSVLPTYAAIDEGAAPVSRASLDTPEDAPVVLAAPRSKAKRSVETLLAAAARLPGVHFWIIGAVAAENLAPLERLGLSDRVRLLGVRSDRMALLAACDVAAIPARPDGGPIVAVEAWAARRPMIVTDVGGLGFAAEQTALMAAKDDAGALAASIRRVLEDGELAGRLVENGRRLYQTHFTRPAFVRAAMALYERIARAAGAERRA